MYGKDSESLKSYKTIMSPIREANHNHKIYDKCLMVACKYDK